MSIRALLLENIHPDASARLAKEGYQVDTLPRAVPQLTDVFHERQAALRVPLPL